MITIDGQDYELTPVYQDDSDNLQLREYSEGEKLQPVSYMLKPVTPVQPVESRWLPKRGDKYFYVDSENGCEVQELTSYTDELDYDRPVYDNNIFRTREQAEYAAQAIKDVLNYIQTDIDRETEAHPNDYFGKSVVRAWRKVHCSPEEFEELEGGSNG